MSDYCIENPILPGFYPDPSICRLGEDFYLVCSSFSYYPGVPIFHSRDLAHWESLGYVLDDPATLRLSPDRISGGIFAPTIRVHDGKFYVIVGNTSTGETLLALTGDPAGSWEVHTIEGPGGDPSLFWDEDGTCWCSYSAMGFGSGAHGIVHRQLNLDTFQLEGEEHFLWGGASVGAWSPEASHMYYRDGWYYLMISEGGTEHYHAVCVARSRDIHGPYTNYRGNPILTHRHLSMHYPICNIGHADIVDTPNGDWYMVALGSRIYGGYHKNLGRETYICPMVWESGWPIAAPDTGKVEWRYPAPAGLPSYPAAQLPARDDFDAPALSWQWNYLGTPNNAPARLEGGELFIRALPEAVTREPQRRAMPDFSKLSEEEAQALRAAMRGNRNIDARALGFVGRRQQHPSYTATAKMRFHAADAREAAGLMILQNDYNQLRVELTQRDGAQVVRVVRHAQVAPNAHIGDILPEIPIREEHGETELGVLPWSGDTLVLRIEANEQSNTFYAGADENHLIPVARNVDGSFMGSETAGGFVGAYIAMFATGNGADTGAEAAFDWFDYCGR